MPSWKTVRSNKQIVKNTRLAITALTFVLILLGTAQVVKFNQLLFSPWRLPNTEGNNFSWNGDFNINLISKSEKISLISYSPKKGEIFIMNIPDELFLETSHGFGKWQLRSIYNLGQFQKEIGGNKLLKDSLSSFFALPIEAIVEGDLANKISQRQLSPIKLLTDFKSDLRLFDFIRLQFGLSKVRFDKIKEINLDQDFGLEKSVLADGTVVYTADFIRLDQFLSELSDPTIVSEHKTIAVFNSTNYPLLAQKAARLITNLGGDVIIVSNGKNKYQKTAIAGEKSKTLQRIKQIFEADDTIDPSDEDLVSSRAQINLFLGEDFFEKQ